MMLHTLPLVGVCFLLLRLWYCEKSTPVPFADKLIVIGIIALSLSSGVAIKQQYYENMCAVEEVTEK